MRRIDTKTIVIAVLAIAIIALGVVLYQESRRDRVEIEFNGDGIAIEGPGR
jgi:hypothetical protein